MNSKRIATTAVSIPFIMLLVVLAGALAWMLSAYFLKPIQLGVPQRATETILSHLPTVTTQPTTSPEISDPGQIVDILEELAQKNFAIFASPGWLHEQMLDAGNSNTIQTYYNETWTHYPQGDGASAEFLSMTKDGPNGSKYYQFTFRLQNGASGDLIQLRKGLEKSEDIISVNLPSVMTLEQTQAGVLASRIKDNFQSMSYGGVKSQLNELRAWYETQNGRSVFTVQGAFINPKSSPPVQIETQTFDSQNGLRLKENIRQEWEDGTLFATFSRIYKTEYVAAPPTETLRTLELAETELRASKENTSATGTSTAQTIRATQDLQLLDKFAYTQAEPLKDGQAILHIMDALYYQQISWLSKTGWKLFRPRDGMNGKWALNRYILTHSQDSGNSCEQMTYYRKGEQIMPQEIRLADGKWGLIGWVEKGEYTEGNVQGEPCRLETIQTAQEIQNERDSFRDLLSGRLNGSYSAWVEEIEAQRYLVLYQDIQYKFPKPSTMDPDTRKLETEDRSIEWSYFSLEKGALLGSNYEIFLENGKTLGAPPVEGEKITLVYEFFEQLPADLAQAFEKAVANLNTYLDNQTK